MRTIGNDFGCSICELTLINDFTGRTKTGPLERGAVADRRLGELNLLFR